MAGTAAATSFCATASLTPNARAREPINCGVRNWDTRPTRLIAIAASPLEPTRNDRRLLTDFPELGAPGGIGKLVAAGHRTAIWEIEASGRGNCARKEQRILPAGSQLAKRKCMTSPLATT